METFPSISKDLAAARAEAEAMQAVVEPEIDARLERHRDMYDEESNPLCIRGVCNLTDLGNAERMAARRGRMLHYSNARKWYVWDGRCWNPDSEATLNRWASHTVRDIYLDATKTDDKQERARISAHALKSESTHAIKNMLELLRWQVGVPIEEDAFDTNPWLLNCLNGTIDLRTGNLREHRHEDLITKIAPVKFDAAATSDIWNGFLEIVTDGDKELAHFLQCAAGYSLCGDYSDEVLFFIYGPTASGKSTFKDAIKSVLGTYAVTADVNTFMRVGSTSQGPRNDLARLNRTRMVCTDEIDEGSKLATGLVKLYTGRDTMTARYLYSEHFEFKSRGKLWMVANHPPKVSADDGAIWRRILRVPFLNEIPADRQDHALKQILCDPKKSGPAILAWAVEGCLAWQRDGLVIPEAVKRSTDEYRQEMNPVGDFIGGACEVNLNNPDFVETSADLWDAYQKWATDNGVKLPVRREAFGKGLKLYGLESKQRPGDRARIWQGIRLCR